MSDPELSKLLRPRSVAVVGASPRAGSTGLRLLQHLRIGGFEGPIYPVNPRAERIQGLQAYASLDALPEVPDAVILCVGSDAVEAPGSTRPAKSAPPRSGQPLRSGPAIGPIEEVDGMDD